MATVFDSVSIKGLSVTHFTQLMSYINDAESNGCYYGNKKQFEQRHKEIKKWVGDIISYAITEGTIIPKRKL